MESRKNEKDELQELEEENTRLQEEIESSRLKIADAEAVLQEHGARSGELEDNQLYRPLEDKIAQYEALTTKLLQVSVYRKRLGQMERELAGVLQELGEQLSKQLGNADKTLKERLRERGYQWLQPMMNNGKADRVKVDKLVAKSKSCLVTLKVNAEGVGPTSNNESAPKSGGTQSEPARVQNEPLLASSSPITTSQKAKGKRSSQQGQPEDTKRQKTMPSTLEAPEDDKLMDTQTRKATPVSQTKQTAPSASRPRKSTPASRIKQEDSTAEDTAALFASIFADTDAAKEATPTASGSGRAPPSRQPRSKKNSPLVSIGGSGSYDSRVGATGGGGPSSTPKRAKQSTGGMKPRSKKDQSK